MDRELRKWSCVCVCVCVQRSRVLRKLLLCNTSKGQRGTVDSPRQRSGDAAVFVLWTSYGMGLYPVRISVPLFYAAYAPHPHASSIPQQHMGV